MSELRVLLGDDHAVLRQGLRKILEDRRDWRVIAEAGNGRDAVREALDLKPDVAVLDIGMPLLNGIEATRQIVRRGAPSVRVVILSMIGAARGYRVRLCVPANVTPERKRILQAFGAEVVYTDPMQGSDGAIIRVKEMYEESPGLYFYPDQYNNPGNWRAHYDTTGPEILEQTGGRITHFVAGLGTSGTFVGAGRKLREVNASIKLISIQPDSPLHGLEGLKHMQTAIVPGIYDASLADEDLGVSTEDAFDMTRRLAKEGLFVGISSGANLEGALHVARRTSDAVFVIVFPDGGEKYLSERLWDESSEANG